MSTTTQIIQDGLTRQNVVQVRLLALCPMLAVSTSVKAALTLGVLTTLVMCIAGYAVSIIRNRVPAAVHLPIFLIIVATLVIITDILMSALAFALSQQLGIFIPLIITNCAVLARLEAFASRRPPILAALDGLACGVGMLAALLLLAVIREIIGTGGIAGVFALPAYSGVAYTLLPTVGFILFGLLIALYRRVGGATAA